MKFKSLLGLCLSGSLLLAGQAALAGDDKEKSNNRSDRAVQVHIDKETGRKVSQDDATEAASDAALAQSTTVPASQLDLVMPAQSQDLGTNADGVKSARLGQESLNYLTVTIDENGNKEFSHQKSSELEQFSKETPTEKGLE